MLVLGNAYVSSMDGYGYWFMVRKKVRDWTMRMGIYLHRVVILFLVILFFMGGFLGVYHCGCSPFILISAHALGELWIVPLSLPLPLFFL